MYGFNAPKDYLNKYFMSKSLSKKLLRSIKLTYKVLIQVVLRSTRYK